MDLDAPRSLRPLARNPRVKSTRGSTRNRPVKAMSYKEPSSSDESESDLLVPTSSPKRRRVASHPQRPSSVPSQTSSAVAHRSKRETFARLPDRHLHRQHTPTLPLTNGVVPPWHTLPYEILLSIFRYALYPAHDDSLRPNPSINWLLRASRTCKAFCEPALSALYECPPLLFLDQPHELLYLLSRDRGYIDYKSKIRRLHLDSKRTLAYSSPGRGHMDLAALLPHLPNLSAVDISDSLDRPPYRQMSQKGRWYYTDSLFEALQEQKIRLKKWRWAGQMMDKSFKGLGQIHLRNPFHTLQHLVLSHLTFPSDVDGPPTAPGLEVLPGDLSSLSELRSLSLESCRSESWDILNRLPNDLTSLAVINCSSFDSSILDPFLVEHGRRLKALVLNHNHALDMSWLVNLRACCPALEALRMDLTYFSSALLTQNMDSEPVFESLLEPGAVPTWPSTLREIELLHLRNWSPEAAVTFFESLVNSSAQLPDLRYLTIKAMLNISWRDRAGFREKWIGQLRNTFLRISPLPDSKLASFRAYKMWNEAVNRKEEGGQEKARPERPRRELKSSVQTDGSDSNEQLWSHGSCEVVDISIDNMRPTETRLTEADFMDSEISGDEDWTGDRSSPRPTYAF